MKTYLFFPVLFLFALPLFAQTDRSRIAPGAENQLAALLNTPTMVTPAEVTPLGRNWFRMEMDSHMFTDQATFRQISPVMIELTSGRALNGQKNVLQASVVSRNNNNDFIADWTSVTPLPLGIKITTKYRTSIRITENSGVRVAYDIRQLPADNETNNSTKNVVSVRCAQEVEINGRKYTYIRIYCLSDVNASILPNARNLLQSNSAPANLEALELVIGMARGR
jgi:hypothetical protein